jgi:hypothetical protein
MRIAIQAAGTIIVFAKNSHLALFGWMHKKGNCTMKNIRYAIIVFVSMPWSSGMVFRMVKKDGQIAPIIALTALAPLTF